MNGISLSPVRPRLDASSAPEATMVDIAFTLAGGQLPADWRYPLCLLLSEKLPWWGEAERQHGIVTLNHAGFEAARVLFSARSRLLLRVPVRHQAELMRLSGQRLGGGERTLHLGTASARSIVAFDTLKSNLVLGAGADENAFIASVRQSLQEMRVQADIICGSARSIASADQILRGYALTVHHLAPTHSLQLQHCGMGGQRALGCGVFYPAKSIQLGPA